MVNTITKPPEAEIMIDYEQIIIKATPNPTRSDRVRAWIFEKTIQTRFDSFMIVALLAIGMLIQQDTNSPVVVWLHQQSHMGAYTWAAFMLVSAALAWALRSWYWFSSFISFLPILSLVTFHINYILATDAPDYVVVLYGMLLAALMIIAIGAPYIGHMIHMLAAYDIRLKELEAENRSLKPGVTTDAANTNGA